jgi:hypothetical protein
MNLYLEFSLLRLEFLRMLLKSLSRMEGQKPPIILLPRTDSCPNYNFTTPNDEPATRVLPHVQPIRTQPIGC